MSEPKRQEELVVEFLDTWAAGSAKPRNGVPERDLRELERRYAVRLPPQFEAYMRRANGMQPNEMDSVRLIHFYGIDEIVPVAGNHANDDYAGYFVFADFMINSHEYAIALAGPPYGKVAIVDDTGPPRVVAGSFAEFMGKYIQSPEALWRPE